MKKRPKRRRKIKKFRNRGKQMRSVCLLLVREPKEVSPEFRRLKFKLEALKRKNKTSTLTEPKKLTKEE